MQWFLYIGFTCIFISGLCVGAWTTGYQQRGNFYSESKDDRGLKKKVATWFAVAGIVSFTVAGIYYLLS
ncbi:DUF5316 domain-containing protein [Paenibacillus sp. N3/727]|uniref:DUF5316 family protein n=1 Tax=Paenibacillus sp. N3/727 TaxID=2925845 RepID=UPI001F531CDF|nr:DUF5316 family protein [Paenibacillus sp. N3/727]UNK19088.1 DUF5316 domain-containing protein [Paenibacillus sp. N3/727]